MGKNVENVDEYIEKAADFAKPILVHLRKLVHQACPNVNETIKWGFPNFENKGILCSMAAFKKHCAFTFWKASIMKDPQKIFSQVGTTAMGQLGKIEKLSDLPSDSILLQYLNEAVQLNEEGVKVSKTSKGSQNKDLEVPDYINKALLENENANKNFNSFSYSLKKEYLEWISEAKTEATRNKRIATAIEWIAEGKERNWKYK